MVENYFKRDGRGPCYMTTLGRFRLAQFLLTLVRLLFLVSFAVGFVTAFIFCVNCYLVASLKFHKTRKILLNNYILFNTNSIVSLNLTCKKYILNVILCVTSCAQSFSKFNFLTLSFRRLS